ncbi:Rho termination factor N-terminal domain-containing protein [Micromonospora sp. DT62]|uniref:Rho termination factor N-terminal domain-containing protein n=1 Tax=Micromonospora sp. DT62 TaxID=3416521 RepID=UPI003CEB9767
MTDPTRDVADLVAALLRGLPAADVAALAEGRARLAVVPVDPAPPTPPPAGTTHAGHPAAARADQLGSAGHPPTVPADRTTHAGHPAAESADRGGAPARPAARRAASAPDPVAAGAALAAMSRRDDGTAYLSGWTARDLRVLAASLELRGVAGLRKADLVARIVDRTIGFRLASAAIRQL